MNKNQRKQGKAIATNKQRELKRRSQANESPFAIQKVNHIEIAFANRTVDDEVSDKGNRDLITLSELAVRMFGTEGRGSFLVLSESNPNAAVYLPVVKLVECINIVIPEAFNAVQSAVSDYDPHQQFVMVNVFSRRRIAITIDAIRSAKRSNSAPRKNSGRTTA